MGILEAMNRIKIWTAEELSKMTPAEQQASFDTSIFTDLDNAPPDVLPLIARARAFVEERIAREESVLP